MRSKWKGINEILGDDKKKEKIEKIDLICPTVHSVLSDDSKMIGNILNKYFSSIGASTCKPIFLKLP